MAMRLPWWLPFGPVPEQSAEQLRAALSRSPSPQVVDVRTPAEYAAGHVGGALSVPITDLARRLPDLRLDPARPVVAICLTAHRSIPAVRLLRARGFDAFQLSGGVRAWRGAGFPLVTGPAALPPPAPG